MVPRRRGPAEPSAARHRGQSPGGTQEVLSGVPHIVGEPIVVGRSEIHMTASAWPTPVQNGWSGSGGPGGAALSTREGASEKTYPCRDVRGTRRDGGTRGAGDTCPRRALLRTAGPAAGLR